LVAIQHGRDPQPIFCVHPIGGEVLCYRSLAKQLGPERTVYGLRADAEAIERDEPSVEQLACQYIRAIRDAEHDPPYRLVGFSLGGLLAYEIARQLAADNCETELLVVIDTHAPGACEGRRISVRTAAETLRSAGFYLWDDVRAVNVRANCSRAARKLRLLAITAARGRRATWGVDGYTGVPDDVIDIRFPGYRASLVRVLGRAALRYRPKPYDGRVTLITARAQRLFQSEAPEEGWRRLASGGVDVATIPGSHFRLLQDPRTVESLAAHIRLRLGPTNRSQPAATS
jgi:thioesterase domain-containing protein